MAKAVSATLRALALALVCSLVACEKTLPSDDPFTTAPAGSTSALVKAVFQGDVDEVSRLLEAGENVDRMHWGVSLLGHAILSRSCDGDLVHLLIESGADLDIVTDEGTPLTMAANMGNEECVNRLREAGASRLGETSGGENFLHAAVKGQNAELVRWALSMGQDVNHGNATGTTPLMSAAHLGNGDIIDLLLDAGADPVTRDHAGKTAADYASDKGNKDIAQALTADSQ